MTPQAGVAHGRSVAAHRDIEDGSAVPYSSVRAVVLSTDVRATFVTKPRRNARRIARPVVGPEAEEERRGGAVAGEDLHEAGHAFARPAIGVDVDLQREIHGPGRSTSRRASATCPRYASKMFFTAVRMPTRGRQSRSLQVLSIFGTRFCTSW